MVHALLPNAPMRPALVAFTLVLLCPALAAAQLTIGRPVFAGRDDPGTGTVRAINAQECADNVLVSLRITNIPTGRSRLDFWRGGEGEGCNDPLKRDGEGDDCEHLSLPSLDLDVIGPQKDLELPVDDLVGCAAMDQNFEIFILAVDSSMSTAAVAEGEWAALAIELDTVAPSAPTNLTGGRGDTQVIVTWDFPEGEAQPRRFEIYVDRGDLTPATDGGPAGADAGPAGADAGPTDAGTDGGPIDGGPDGGPDAGSDAGPTATDAGSGGTDSTVGTGPAECPSAVLLPGAAIPDGTPYTESSGSSREDSLNPESLGLGFGETAAVTVVAVDEALNRSVIGEVVCITRVDTVGLCDEPGACKSGCQCSTPGGSAPGWPAGLAAAALIALATWRRRRNR